MNQASARAAAPAAFDEGASVSHVVEELSPALPVRRSETDRYAAVRMNALRHGILTAHAVLAHEDRAEFDSLHLALVQEHHPSGTTEAHLVEQLATIMWRQRRVLMAEGAAINRSLKRNVSEAASVARAAAPFEGPIAMTPPEVRDVVTMSKEDVMRNQQDAQADLEATRSAMRHLWRSGPRAYRRALAALSEDSRISWLDVVAEGNAEPTSEALRAYVHDTLLPVCTELDRHARLHDSIKQQTLGEGLASEQLENVGRYETHLDRKLERTLAMLIKLKELRRPSP